jgi:CRP-like cAMP-binding protein
MLHRVAEQLSALTASAREASREFVVAMRDGSVDPRRWLELVQPTMAWALPDEHGATLPGPNGLQLASLQVWDTLLGVPQHSELARSAMAARPGMPREHRQLLDAAGACGPLLRSFLNDGGTAVTRRRYREALDALRRFRTAHRVRAARYLRAGRPGTSARVSTGLGLAWRPNDEGLDPVVAFERLADERIQELARVSVNGSGPEVVSTLALPEVDVARLLSRGTPQRFVDQLILRTGEANDALWYVVDGLVRVETRPVGDSPVAIGQLGPGEFFGEVSFLTGLPVSAWIWAEGDVDLVRTDRAGLEQIIAADAPLASRFHRAMAVSLARRLRETTSLLTEAEAVRIRPPSARAAGT